MAAGKVPEVWKIFEKRMQKEADVIRAEIEADSLTPDTTQTPTLNQQCTATSPATQTPKRPYVLPGVIELLDHLSKQKNVVQGLVTGNLQATAMIKLKSAGIDTTLFSVGAYGSDPHQNRNCLPPLARNRALEQYSGLELQESDVIVIGDTPKDIECAKANNFVSVAVATGRFDVDQLREHNPDYVFKDLSDIAAVYELLAGVPL
eukprot:TRINITY_DN3707_c0_g1_i1.p1 TRINITY_DN3707_c0_g1~~TRINITY_DN3707_c0_g1_i1.p1  ORF type:complete len:205 (+),score=34.97 TRINITY_DN3707_c0_g1_i1:356-970(+)